MTVLTKVELGLLLDVVDAARQADQSAFGSPASPNVNVDVVLQFSVRKALKRLDESRGVES